MTDLTPEKIAELEALDAKRTQGEWRHEQPFHVAVAVRTIHGPVPERRVDFVRSSRGRLVIPMPPEEGPGVRSDDMAFIAAAANAIPALLADWRRMREALTAPLTRDEWEKIHDEARESYRIWARRATQDARPEDDMEHHVAQAMARAYAARAALGGRNER